jgi:arginyl-tRNA synthetase
MNLETILHSSIQKAIQQVFEIEIEKIEFQTTRKDFEGDVTVVIFPLLKLIKGNPADIGNKIGTYLVEHVAVVEKFNVVSGFLNIVISDEYYIHFFSSIKNDTSYGFVLQNQADKAVMVEYSSPNTNKPLHLGHIRNNLLGFSVAEIIKASGKKVYKTQIINDRGIHICKSMLAWQKFGNGQTPESTGLKGDKLVGNYYVAFDKEYKSQINALIDKGANVTFFDPVAGENFMKLIDPSKHSHIKEFSNKYDCLNSTDALVTMTEWREFSFPDFQEIKSRLKNPIIFDARNLFKTSKVIEHGFTYYAIGKKVGSNT